MVRDSVVYVVLYSFNVDDAHEIFRKPCLKAVCEVCCWRLVVKRIFWCAYSLRHHFAPHDHFFSFTLWFDVFLAIGISIWSETVLIVYRSGILTRVYDKVETCAITNLVDFRIVVDSEIFYVGTDPIRVSKLALYHLVARIFVVVLASNSWVPCVISRIVSSYFIPNVVFRVELNAEKWVDIRRVWTVSIFAILNNLTCNRLVLRIQGPWLKILVVVRLIISSENLLIFTMHE